tara:strand:+ start:230 stop:631 length:402 start_codon:yes stop_codon:yes gene_type:complete
MARKKSNLKTKTTKKAVKKTQPKVVEEKQPEPEITGYIVSVSFKREPVNKDIVVADLFYTKSTKAITLQCHAPQHEAHIEMIIEGDISVETAGSVTMVSKSESPEAWITSLYNSKEFSGNPFIAQEAQPIYEA